MKYISEQRTFPRQRGILHIDKTIHQEIIVILNVYSPNNWAEKYMKQKLTKWQEKVNDKRKWHMHKWIIDWQIHYYRWRLLLSLQFMEELKRNSAERTQQYLPAIKSCWYYKVLQLTAECTFFSASKKYSARQIISWPKKQTSTSLKEFQL